MDGRTLRHAVAAAQTPPVTPTIDAGLRHIPAFYLDDEAVLPDCGTWRLPAAGGFTVTLTACSTTPIGWLNERLPAYFDPGKWGSYSKATTTATWSKRWLLNFPDERTHRGGAVGV